MLEHMTDENKFNLTAKLSNDVRIRNRKRHQHNQRIILWLETFWISWHKKVQLLMHNAPLHVSGAGCCGGWSDPIGQ